MDPVQIGQYGYKILLMHSMLGQIIQQTTIQTFFSYFSRKQDLTFHANVTIWRQFAWNVKACFSGEKRTDLSSAELA